jgi:hypothetical protein
MGYSPDSEIDRDGVYTCDFFECAIKITKTDNIQPHTSELIEVAIGENLI